MTLEQVSVSKSAVILQSSWCLIEGKPTHLQLSACSIVILFLQTQWEARSVGDQP